jgi:hypothetical protein
MMCTYMKKMNQLEVEQDVKIDGFTFDMGPLVLDACFFDRFFWFWKKKQQIIMNW